jgi:16S rRNA (guanine(966)-N(2))-methyltransferase RsmD
MKIQAPPGNDVRPTSDKLRGAVMSMLGGFLSGERVLDVCAGTGAVALEWLSRGASEATAMEADPVALESLRANAKHVRLDAQLTVLPGDVLLQLPKLVAAGRRFELVYVDPPYDAGLYAPILALLPALLAPGAQVFVESRTGLPEELRVGWTHLTQRRYGGGWLDRLQWPEVAP